MKLKAVDKLKIIYHILSVSVLIAFLAVGIFVLKSGVVRAVESFRDFGTSFAFWFCRFFGIEREISATITMPSAVDFSSSIVMDLESFGVFLVKFGSVFISPDNIADYILFIVQMSFFGFWFVLLGILFLYSFFSLIKTIYSSHNNNYNKTKPLITFEKITAIIYLPVKKFMRGYIDFLKNRMIYVYVFIFFFFLNTNVVTLAVEFVSYLFYFSAAFNFSSLLIYGYKTFMDVFFAVKTIPVVVWIVTFLIIYERCRREKGLRIIKRLDSENEDFSQNVALFISGRPGTGKTTMLTYLALKIAVKFRKNAFKQMLDIDMRFPCFPYIKLEKAIQKGMESGKIYNNATARAYVCFLKKRFFKNQVSENLFGYDFQRYGMEYDDGLKIRYLFDELENYARLYFMYIINTSLIQSNYCIREDSHISDLGNLPLWDFDFFRKDTRTSEAYTRHSHILDMDCLRLGRLVVENNKFSKYNEFGVFAFTECAKDRGNQYDHIKYRKEDKAKDDSVTLIREIRGIINRYSKFDYDGKNEILNELKKLDFSPKQKANPTNDYMNLMIKMFRHLCTIDGVCYCIILLDEQRASSLNADFLDLCVRIKILSKEKPFVCFPGFWLDNLIFQFVYNRFLAFYERMRYLRGDTSLLLYILKFIVAIMKSRYDKIFNVYSNSKLHYVIEDGSSDTSEEHTFNLLWMLIYRSRFESACYGDFFEKRALKSKIGLVDVPTFDKLRAPLNNLLMLHSYFINQLTEEVFND